MWHKALDFLSRLELRRLHKMRFVEVCNHVEDVPLDAELNVHVGGKYNVSLPPG